jgi:hypothetical protein
MEGAAVVVMEGETISGKPLAEFFMAKGIEGAAVVVMEEWEPQVNHWHNL